MTKINQFYMLYRGVSDLENIKEQAIWIEDSQKYKLPDLVIPRTKLPPAGKVIFFYKN